MAKKTKNGPRMYLIVAAIIVFLIGVFLVTNRVSDNRAMSLLSSASESLDGIGIEDPIIPKDWPYWPFYTLGCKGEAVVSNRYVDRGASGGYTRPDYIKCSDGRIIDDPSLNDGVVRTKQGWDQIARVVCCQSNGCGTYQTDERRFGEKCDARTCAKLHIGGKCAWEEEYKNRWPQHDVPENLCCYDYTRFKK